MLYPNRYEHEQDKRLAYCEAFDYITIYGIPRFMWDYKKWGLNRETMKEIWKTAEKDAAGHSMARFAI